MPTLSQIWSGQLHKSLTFSWLRVESETWCSTKTSASFASFPIQIGRPIMPPYPPPPPPPPPPASLEGLAQCSLMVKISSSFGSTTLGCNPFTMTSHPFRKYRVNQQKEIDFLIIINQDIRSLFTGKKKSNQIRTDSQALMGKGGKISKIISTCFKSSRNDQKNFFVISWRSKENNACTSG